MGRPVNPNVPEQGYVSKRLFENTGSICASDFAVVDDATTQKKVVVDPSSQASSSTYTLKTPATSGNVTLTLPTTSGTLVTTATETNSFSIIQPPNGTSPTAGSPTDTLTLTSSDSTVTITGNSSTKAIDLKANVSTGTPATLDTSQLYNHLGTCTNQGMIYSIDGNKKFQCQFKGIAGTLTTGTFSITLPAAKTVNTTLYATDQYVLGEFFRYTSAGTTNNASPNGPWPIIFDKANGIITISLNYGTGNNMFINNQDPSSFIGAGGAFWGYFEVYVN